MEGNFRRGTPNLPKAVNMGCNRDLTRSNSVASSLTAENCKDVFRRSENVTPDDRTGWTDEKHNLFIHQLEVSFVKQLHQSKSLLTECPEHSQRDISQSLFINVDSALEQINVSGNGCWKNLNWVRAEPLSSGTSTDSCDSLKSNWIYNSKRMHCPPPPAEMPDSLKLCSTVKQGKGIISHGLATCSQEFSLNNPCDGNLFDLTREGMGQNFLDADNQSTTNFESKTKRLKTSLSDSSSPDQFVLSRESPTADYSVINSSLSEKD